MAFEVRHDDVIDWVIAEDHEDALLVLQEYYDDPPERDITVTELDDDVAFTVVTEDAIDNMMVTQTMAVWKQQGRGLIASTER